MGSPHWAQSLAQPWSAAGSLWGWAVSRVQLNRTARLFHQDEEMLVLTHSDELNRTYGEDPTSSLDPIKTKNVPCPAEQNVTASSSSRRTSWPETPSFKESRATVLSTGPRTITITSTVSGADSLWFQNSTSYSEGEGRTFKGQRRRSERTDDGLLQGTEGGEGKETGKEASLTCSHLEEEEEERGRMSPNTRGPNPSPTITAWEAGWNITNAIQGIFVLGLPFALVQSGYLGLVLLVLSAWVCNHTGRILVACLYEEEHCSGGLASGSKVRVRHSYQDVVEACCKGLWPYWPRLGGWMVNVAQVVELLMTCTLYLVVSSSLLSDSLWALAVPRSACSLVALLFLLPCLLLTDLRPVSTLSLLCSLAHILISLMVMLYCLSRASSWSWSFLPLSVDPEDFLVSVGVIIFSYTSQIFLPPLEGSMEDRGQFDAMLGWTHAAACVMKTTFSLLAVLTWGPQTSEVITDNLPSDLRPLLSLCLLAKALLSFPLPFYSAAEILQSCLLTDSSLSKPGGGGGVSRPALVLRGALLMTTFLLALLVPRFSLLMGLTGSVTGAAMTLILPCLFHLRLRWRRLSPGARTVDAGILTLGVVCSGSGVVCSLKRLVQGL